MKNMLKFATVLTIMLISQNLYAQNKYMKLIDNYDKPNGYLVIEDKPCEINLHETTLNKIIGEESKEIMFNGYIENALGQTRRVCWFRKLPISSKHEPLVIVVEEVVEGDYNVGSFSQYYFKDEK